MVECAESMEEAAKEIRQLASVLQRVKPNQLDASVLTTTSSMVAGMHRNAAMLGLLVGAVTQVTKAHTDTHRFVSAPQARVKFYVHASTYGELNKSRRPYSAQFAVFGRSLPLEIKPLQGILGSMQVHDHACMSFSGPSRGADEFCVEYMMRALSLGASVLTIFSAAEVQAHLQALSNRGVDSAALLASQRITTTSNCFYAQPFPTVDARVSFVIDKVVRTLHDSRCDRIFIIADVACPGNDVSGNPSLLIEYEKAVNDALYSRHPVTGMCLYNTAVCAPALVNAALHAHPTCLTYAG
eukprot:TRINITY_DN2319_c0_g2_i2.p1 TRINITY_DN2319_c0_g2~~TRINITY_DN2319_c0_g2_i2.p1  ORF type:complete len:298 (+),score=58.60 TRINITY_DN2319_c0_g2_i2:645-1538(+)